MPTAMPVTGERERSRATAKPKSPSWQTSAVAQALVEGARLLTAEGALDEHDVELLRP